MKRPTLISYVRENAGHTAREIAEGILGAGARQQLVYAALQALCESGTLQKFNRSSDGLQAYRLADGSADTCLGRRNAEIDMSSLRHKLDEAAEKVIARLRGDANDRMHSWSHCFKFFHHYRSCPNRESADLAALHLAFYLASYGMYRGSTRLLGKDYKFLVPVVRKLVTQPFVTVGVSSFNVADATCSDRAVKLHQLCEDLGSNLDEIGLAQENKGTLVTKILLGTWCSVPAFDTAFKRALKTSGFGKAVWGQKNFLRAFDSLHATADAFQVQVHRFHAAGYTQYPAIRVIDAIFWHLGGGDKLTASGEIED